MGMPHFEELAIKTLLDRAGNPESGPCYQEVDIVEMAVTVANVGKQAYLLGGEKMSIQAISTYIYDFEAGRTL